MIARDSVVEKWTNTKRKTSEQLDHSWMQFNSAVRLAQAIPGLELQTLTTELIFGQREMIQRSFQLAG